MRTLRGIEFVTLTLLAAAPLLGCELEATDAVDPEEIDDVDPADDGDGDDGSAALVATGSCEDLATRLRTKLFADIDARAQANLDSALLAVTTPCEQWGEEEEEEEEEEEAGEFSKTNTQEDDVDEADFVKNDGGYLYILADGRFWVLDAWPATEAQAISSFSVKGTPRRMYVHADTAVIYSSLDPWPGGAAAECTYGYDCDFTGDGHDLLITILDISDRAAPRRTRELLFDGAYLNSRRVGMDVHTAVVFPEFEVPGLSDWPAALPRVGCGLADQGYTPAEVYALFEHLREQNRALIDGYPISELLPTIRDTRFGEGEIAISQGPLSACEDVYLSPTGDARGFLSLVSFAIGEQAPVAATTISSRPGAVYGTKDSLYVAVRHRRSPGDPWFPELADDIVDATAIHQFALVPGGSAAAYAASGVVKGRVLNQFAMDEHDGVFRIATTHGHLPSPDVHSTVSLLRAKGSRLVELGRIDQIAPTEDIRAVRFRDDVGYVVTFKKTDPLFVLDLADPSAPSVLGELKIPGFSTYMHVLDEDHLLTMGYDADDQGDFAWFQGIQLQIIDVSDLANPLLEHKEVIGTRGSTSDAATNHLAFTFFRPRELLAVPMTICDEGGGGQYGDLMTFSGLLVYRVDIDDGFTAIGGVPHEPPETLDNWSGKCNNWWTDSNSKVKRSVFMDDWVFSIARDRVKVAHLDDLEHPVASIPLTD